MSSSFSLNDPVHVNRDDSSRLEGVVAYLGPVSPADIGAGDWVGVRLTGQSSKLGEHDGTVGGKTYFSSPPRSGIFVRLTDVTKRTLTRLEELRLRRELASGTTTSSGSTATSQAGGGGMGASSSTSPTSNSVGASSSFPTSTIGTTSSASTLKSSTTSSAVASESSSSSAAASRDVSTSMSSSSRSKLEELRQRRAALKEAQQAATNASTAGNSIATASTTSTLLPSTPVSGSSVEGLAPATLTTTGVSTTSMIGEPETPMSRQIQELREKLRVKEQEMAFLREDLSKAEAETQHAKARAEDLEDKARKARTKTVITEDGREQMLQLENEKDDLKDQLEQSQQELSDLRRLVERERQGEAMRAEELQRAKSEATAYSKELQALAEQSAQRGASDASHYKERAKLQAEIGAMRRKVEQLEKEKVGLENNIEDVTLDKEQLQEEKETLEDQLEELRIDAETAQMEVEELRMELENAQAAAERITSSVNVRDESSTVTGSTAASTSSGDSVGGASASSGGATAGSGGDAEEMVQALSVQNARLREALIRLREQSSVEKMEISRQFRAAEKDAETGKALIAEVEQLRAQKLAAEEQINDLKDMVEQGSAFETMVEDLSDRVLSLEEDNVMLHSTIREMEEAAELTAEMEEVQADELKALGRDLEGRDTVIRNLEEAIKMQRRREEDFRRTVGNYRTTVETLKQEKKALLELQQGGEGEKSDLIASSQKALAKAAQLVTDAADMRKREALAVMDKIDHQIYKHLSNRLESLLPQSVAAAEISAVKGELLASKVVGKASKSLNGISSSFAKVVRPILPQSEEESGTRESFELNLTDDAEQKIKTMFHQTEFAQVIIELSSDLIRYLVAGQWPDYLQVDSSTELGSLLGHSVADLDNVLGTVLKSLKEEGCLTLEQSNIGALRQTVQGTMLSLRSDIEREDGTLVPASWNPPGWHLMRDASFAKFSCMGAAAAVSSALSLEQEGPPKDLLTLYNKLEQSSTQAAVMCLRLANLDVKNDKLVEELSAMVARLREKSENLVDATQKLLLTDGDASSCVVAVQNVLSDLAKLSASLRSASMSQTNDENFHAMSPEADDTWDLIALMARMVRSIDGDAEDVNYSQRARAIEHRLGEAVDNQPKLSLANTKVASLEKSLQSRSKEIAMQNARLSELEKILAKSSSASTAARARTAELKSSEEFNSLKEENRVLMEAMDVLQRQVDEYESEIRSLKDFKSPKRGGAGSRTTRRALTSDLAPGRGGADEIQSSTGSLEATLFRPALQNALNEAAKWKSVATTAAILELPPLPTEFGFDDQVSDNLLQLESAISECRLVKATIPLVDLTNRHKSPRQQLNENRLRTRIATERLETIVLRCQGQMG